MKTTPTSHLDNLVSAFNHEEKPLMQAVMKAILIYTKVNAVNFYLTNQFAWLRIGCGGIWKLQNNKVV